MTEQDNRFDLEVRSILEDAREEVPESVWEHLAPRLDIMTEERRRKVIMRWTRRITAVTSVAAAIAIAVLFPWGAEIPEHRSGQQIAVAEPSHEIRPEEKYIALAATPASADGDKASSIKPQEIPSAEETARNTGTPGNDAPPAQCRQETRTDAEDVRPEAASGQIQDDKAAGSIEYDDTISDLLADDFGTGEEAVGKKKPSVSIVLSGNASSNTMSGSGRSAPMRAPEKLQPDSRYEKESTYSIPLAFGIGTRIEFTPRWSMSVGVNYTMLSRSFKGFYTDVSGTALPETSFVNTQGYIGVPVNVYFNILRSDFADFYTYAGGTVEKCIFNRFTAKSQIPETNKEKTGGVQFSANIGFGVEFILADWLGLYIDPSLRYYFKGNQPKSIRTQQPLQLGFELGLRVRL